MRDHISRASIFFALILTNKPTHHPIQICILSDAQNAKSTVHQTGSSLLSIHDTVGKQHPDDLLHLLRL